ncbi:MAG: hypothetical protein ACXWJM_07035 [Ramlibacter sp.]
MNGERPTTDSSALAPAAVAAVAGVALFAVAAVLTGKREPWDASLYWAVFYPASILVSALLGYVYPQRPWRWAIVLFEAQFLAMCIRTGELGNLWPFGMALFAVVALPAVAAAHLAARLSRQ